MAGRDVGQIPANALGKVLGGRPYWWLISRMFSVGTPIGRKMRSSVLHHGNPLIRTGRRDGTAVGVGSTPWVSGIVGGRPELDDGRVLPVQAVIWATGFRPDFGWIDLPIFDGHGYPRHDRGVVAEAPGLTFVGLHFQSALSSALLGGVGADAKAVVERIGRTTRDPEVPVRASSIGSLKGNTVPVILVLADQECPAHSALLRQRTHAPIMARVGIGAFKSVLSTYRYRHRPGTPGVVMP